MRTPLTEGPLRAFYDVLDFVSQVKEPEEDKIWGRVVDKLTVALDCEAATYYSFLAAKNHLLPRHATGANAGDMKGTPVDIRTGLCGWVATHREPLIIEDAYKDKRFLREVDSVTGFTTHNCLCLPLIDRVDLTGVVQLLNKREGTFSPADLEFALAVCRLSSLGLRAMRLEATVDKVTARNASIIENLGGGFMAVDTHGRIILCNPAAKRILDLPATLKLNVPAEQTLLHVPRLCDILIDTLATRKVAKRQEIAWSYKGQDRLLGYSTILIQDQSGEITGAGITFQDITQLKK